jgi:hypothetical protein
VYFLIILKKRTFNFVLNIHPQVVGPSVPTTVVKVKYVILYTFHHRHRRHQEGCGSWFYQHSRHFSPIFRNMSTALNSASYDFVIMCQTRDTYAGDPRVRHALRLNKRRES